MCMYSSTVAMSTCMTLSLYCIGEAGEFDTAEQREREIVRQKLRARGVSRFYYSGEKGNIISGNLSFK